MPFEFDIKVEGLAELAASLAQIPGAVDRALARAAQILSRDGTRYWRGLVSRRSGRMRRALSVETRKRGQGVEVIFFPDPSRAFYYRFQSGRDRWNRQLADYLNRQAPKVVAAEVDREIANVFG